MSRNRRTSWPIALLLAAWVLPAVPCSAQTSRLNLVANPSQWSVSTDRAGAKMALAKVESGLAVDVTADGATEDYPKARLQFAKPQDWRPYSRVNLRLRVTCTDPNVRQKSIALVFYDEETRLAKYPGKPMKQQSVSHVLPVNRWVDLNDWLTTIHRSAIRQLDLYLYELPPGTAHRYRWEVARLELEKVSGEAVAFDDQVFGRNEVQGALGTPAGSVKTEDGLQLGIGSAGEIAQISVDGKSMGSARRDCPTGLLVRDVTRIGPPVMVGGRVEQSGHEVKQTAQVAELGLAVSATYKPHPGYTEIVGSVADLRGQDRAVTVYLALPVAEGPWQWWDSVAKSRTAAADTLELGYFEHGMGYGLGGRHSKYPLGAVTLPGTAGLTLAVRMDEPVVHRIVYNPRLRLFYLAIDFGLVPESRADGRPLSAAPFRILLYRHDAAWGFRSALSRYHQLFPEFFAKRVTREGGWYVWGDMSKTPGVLDAGLGFHWGPADSKAVKWDNAHGPLALLYIEPQTYQQTMEDFNRRPTKEEVLARLQKLVQGDPQELAKVASQPYRVYPLSPTPGSVTDRIRSSAQTVARSLNYDIAGQPHVSIGQFGWMQKSKWGAILSCNLAPAIPDGKGQMNLRQILPPSLQDMEKQGARYDGIGLDSLGGYGEHSAVNYRREHFRYSQCPLSFSSLDHQPVQVAAFATVEWVRDLAREMHAQGRVLMANCSWGFTPGWLTFAAPYLDIFGAEATEFADPDFIRAIANRKSCTDLPYKPRPAWEIPRHWLHTIYPGHGNDLEALGQSVGLLRELVAAGWEPITGARVSPEQLHVERYGAGNRIYLVLHNPTKQPTTARVKPDHAILGAQGYKASVGPVGLSVQHKDGSLEVLLAGKETLVIVLKRL